VIEGAQIVNGMGGECLDQFFGHQMGMTGLFEGEVEVILELFRTEGCQVKPGADATSQGEEFRGSEVLRQAFVAAQDGEQKAV